MYLFEFERYGIKFFKNLVVHLKYLNLYKGMDIVSCWTEKVSMNDVLAYKAMPAWTKGGQTVFSRRLQTTGVPVIINSPLVAHITRIRLILNANSMNEDIIESNTNDGNDVTLL
jgi:hypothetical protein